MRRESEMAATVGEVLPGGAPRVRRRGGIARHLQHPKVLPYLFLAPALALMLSVSVYPIGYAIDRSLHETDYLMRGPFIGLENYTGFFAFEGGATSLINSLVYCIGTLVLALPFGFLLAILLNRPLPMRTAIRTVLILPWIVSQTIVALLWSWILNPDFGPIPYVVEASLGARIAVFGDPNLAMLGVILANLWHSYPLALVLMLAALQGIPQDLYEAAKIDGAGAWKTFRRITLPLVSPTLLITTIMLTLHYFNMVTLIWTITGGGPISATETLSVRLFNEAFVNQNLGIASAIGVIIAALNVAFSLSYIRLLRQEQAT